MGDPKGFLAVGRQLPIRRPVNIRLHDWREVYEPFPLPLVREQASRCMDCGIPFCHEGCPLGNLIPEWNDLVYRGRWAEASARLEATNNFPEFTGRLCPAPCEGSCVLGINAEPVAIKQVELEIAEWGSARLEARLALAATGKTVAVVGSGPAGLAAAQQLTRAGHNVTVFERAERIGGLLRYGIPEFKMEKAVLDGRLRQMEAEGTVFRAAVAIGGFSPVTGTEAENVTRLPARSLVADFDAVVLAGGATRPRDLPVPGRALEGVHFAMEFLKPSNLACEGTTAPPGSAPTAAPISAAGRHVVIIGGGDTGADCLGTVHRQGAASVHQLEILPAPPSARADDNPWPTWPLIFRTSSAHEEGGERLFAVTTLALVDDGAGRVGAIKLAEVRQEIVDGRPTFVAVAGTAFSLPADLVLIAMGFLGPETTIAEELGLELDARGNVAVGRAYETNVAGVFACGDMARGQSLIVWAIAEGRSAAASADRYLMGATALPQPIHAGQLALR